MSDASPPPRLPEGGLRRVIIEAASPEVDGGRYPAKHIVRDTVFAECDAVADGHDAIAGRVLYRPTGDATWQVAPLVPLANDRWRGSFWELTFEAWIDAFTTWRTGTEKKMAASQDITVELLMGAKAGDPGSPWAIGAAEGGHKAVHPELGSLEDFDRLVVAARALKLELALDIAFQVSPDHPDILPEHLQHGGRPTFLLRLALAATLSSNYGMYGPAFELMEHVPRPGSEEYIDNENFQLRSWNLDDVFSDGRYLWTGSRNYVELDPALFPVSLFVVRRKVRSEHDFEYFL